MCILIPEPRGDAHSKHGMFEGFPGASLPIWEGRACRQVTCHSCAQVWLPLGLCKCICHFFGFFSQENRECRIEKLSPLSPVLQLVTLVHPLGAIAFIPATPNCIYWLFSFCLPDLIFFYFIAVSCCPSPPRSSPRVRISNQGRAQVPGVCCAGLLWQLANVWSVPSGTLSSMLF